MQIPRKQLSISPTRSSGRKHRSLATLLRVASGQRPSWNRLVIVTMLYGKLLWSHQDRVWAHSQGRLQLLWSKQDDGQDWPTAPNQRSQSLENPPTLISGRGPREEEGLPAVINIVPCTFLQTVWERHDPCHSWTARIAFRLCFQAP